MVMVSEHYVGQRLMHTAVHKDYGSDEYKQVISILTVCEVRDDDMLVLIDDILWGNSPDALEHADISCSGWGWSGKELGKAKVRELAAGMKAGGLKMTQKRIWGGRFWYFYKDSSALAPLNHSIISNGTRK